MAVSDIEHPPAKMSEQSHDLVEDKRTVKVKQFNKTVINDTARCFLNKSIILSSPNMETYNIQSEEITQNNKKLSLYETTDYKIAKLQSNQEVFRPIEKLEYTDSNNFRNPSCH